MYRPRCLRPAAEWERCRWPCPGSGSLGPLVAASAAVRADLHVNLWGRTASSDSVRSAGVRLLPGFPNKTKEETTLQRTMQHKETTQDYFWEDLTEVRLVRWLEKHLVSMVNLQMLECVKVLGLLNSLIQNVLRKLEAV